MMLNFRPVDCYTKQPFTDFIPGYVNETIFGDRVESGWSNSVYGSDQNQFALPVSHGFCEGTRKYHIYTTPT